jgi:hypothetical protein
LALAGTLGTSGCNSGGGGSSGGARVGVETTAIGDVIVTLQSTGIDVLANDLDGRARGLTIVEFAMSAT